MTTKITTSDSIFDLHHSFYNESNGTIQSDWVYKGLVATSDTFTGGENPSWKDEIRNGINATTLASGVRYTSHIPYFFARWDSHLLTGYPYETMETYEGFPYMPYMFGIESDPPDSLITSVRNQCIAKFVSRADATRSSFEAGQDLGEWKETIRTIVHPLASVKSLLFNHLGRVKKLSQVVKDKKHLVKAIADSYLEFNFGVKPLIADIQAGVTGAMLNHDHFDTQPVSASAKGSYTINPYFQQTIGAGNVIVLVTGKCTGEYQVRYKGGIRTGAEGGKLPALQQMQLDLPHFIPTLWDLVPYSWVVDYFTNIGDIVQAISFPRSNVAWGNVTTRRVITYNYSYDWQHPYDESFLIASMERPVGNPSGQSVRFTRAPFVGQDLLPDFRFQIPLTEKPWENMTALLTSRLVDVRKSISQLRR